MCKEHYAIERIVNVPRQATANSKLETAKHLAAHMATLASSVEPAAIGLPALESILELVANFDLIWGIVSTGTNLIGVMRTKASTMKRSTESLYHTKQ